MAQAHAAEHGRRQPSPRCNPACGWRARTHHLQHSLREPDYHATHEHVVRS
jgi:hypothetical protein